MRFFNSQIWGTVGWWRMNPGRRAGRNRANLVKAVKQLKMVL